MAEINYSDAERRAYMKADPTAALLARIADLEAEVERLELELEDDKKYSAGWRAAREDCGCAE